MDSTARGQRAILGIEVSSILEVHLHLLVCGLHTAFDLAGFAIFSDYGTSSSSEPPAESKLGENWRHVVVRGAFAFVPEVLDGSFHVL